MNEKGGEGRGEVSPRLNEVEVEGVFCHLK